MSYCYDIVTKHRAPGTVENSVDQQMKKAGLPDFLKNLADTGLEKDESIRASSKGHGPQRQAVEITGRILEGAILAK